MWSAMSGLVSVKWSRLLKADKSGAGRANTSNIGAVQMHPVDATNFLE